MIEDPELHRLFKAESAEHLTRLDDGLLRLEKTPTDPALLEEVFRESHSLKGAARMLGLTRIEAAAHGLEGVFNAARKGETKLTPETIEHMNGALTDLRRRVQEALSGESAAAPAPAFFSPSSAIPHEQGEEREKQPPTLPVKPIPAANEPFRIETVRVETRKLDDLLTQVGELAVIQGRTQHGLALLEELLGQWATLTYNRHHTCGAAPFSPHGAAETASAHFGDLLKQTRDVLFDDSAHLESTVNLLADQVRSIRLLPLSTVFALFPRMVRDLAREQGKEAELALDGGDITVDKRILEEMKDPLMHLIRNAIDHGIEPPAERQQFGKPQCGTVRLRAIRENANVRLEVSDDGRGLDLTTIRQVAKKRDLYDENTLAAMPSAQLQQLIFMPGFSTSTYVTELSGRGVGLDVVRVNVERLKGSIHLESADGQGLTVQLRLPLSLATTRLLLASVRGRLYGVPVEFVHTSRRVREADIFTLEGRPAILLDGQPLIAARLADLLELPTVERAARQSDTLACTVIQAGDERLGLLTDELLAEEEVVPKPLGPPLQRVRNVSALAVLSSGEICAVLNPADLLRSTHKGTQRAEGKIGNGELPTQNVADKAIVLLAEDSALIRAMEKRILEDGGYEVITAVDGMDALNILDSRPFSAVVSDIVMPNMDGLALTARIRAESRHKDLPVILVTTLASDEDKRRGLDAGANAYIPKPSFDQRVLLDTLKRLIVR
jgi:two-component system chemotaxis sensor kinase CheA